MSILRMWDGAGGSRINPSKTPVFVTALPREAKPQKNIAKS